MIGKVTKDIRITKKITMKEVYEKTGISDSRLHRFENGNTKVISIDELASLAKLYSVSLEYLLCRAGYINYQESIFENTEQLDESEIKHIQNGIDLINKLKGGIK